jgi:hypothetical protein
VKYLKVCRKMLYFEKPDGTLTSFWVRNL